MIEATLFPIPEDAPPPRQDIYMVWAYNTVAQSWNTPRKLHKGAAPPQWFTFDAAVEFAYSRKAPWKFPFVVKIPGRGNR